MKGNIYSLFVLMAAFFWGREPFRHWLQKAPHRWHLERSGY